MEPKKILMRPKRP